MSRFALAAVLSGALVIMGSSCKSTSDAGAPMPTVTQPTMQPTVTTSDASKRPATPMEASLSGAETGTAMSSEEAPMAEPRIDWARMAKAKVTKLDWANRVGMVDVGRLDGVRPGSKLYSMRNDQLTALMIPVQVFQHQSICLVGELPPGMSSAKIHAGDQVAARPRGGLPKSIYPDAVSKQLDSVRGPMPGEEQLKSLQESLSASAQTGQPTLGAGASGAKTETKTPAEVAKEAKDAKAAMEAERKAIEKSWKDTVAQVKRYTNPVTR